MNKPRSATYLFVPLISFLLLLQLALSLHVHQQTFSYYDNADSLHQDRIECSLPHLPALVNDGCVVVVSFTHVAPLIVMEPDRLVSRLFHIIPHNKASPQHFK